MRNGLHQKPIIFVAASTTLKDILLPLPSLHTEQAKTSRVFAHCHTPYDLFKHHLLVMGKKRRVPSIQSAIHLVIYFSEASLDECNVGA